MLSTGRDQKPKSPSLLPTTDLVSSPGREEGDKCGLQETRSVKHGEYLHPSPALIRRHLQFEEEKRHGVGFTMCCSRGEADPNSQVSKGTCELNDALTDFSPRLCISNVKKKNPKPKPKQTGPTPSSSLAEPLTEAFCH